MVSHFEKSPGKGTSHKSATAANCQNGPTANLNRKSVWAILCVQNAINGYIFCPSIILAPFWPIIIVGCNAKVQWTQRRARWSLPGQVKKQDIYILIFEIEQESRKIFSNFPWKVKKQEFWLSRRNREISRIEKECWQYFLGNASMYDSIHKSLLNMKKACLQFRNKL